MFGDRERVLREHAAVAVAAVVDKVDCIVVAGRAVVAVVVVVAGGRERMVVGTPGRKCSAVE